MRRRNLIFVHVPRVAGTSIAQTLYGQRCTRHYSIRYYKTVAPEFWAAADSFAVLRDPFDRFASAYAFVRSGGTESCRLSDVFVRQTADCAASTIIFPLSRIATPCRWTSSCGRKAGSSATWRRARRW